MNSIELKFLFQGILFSTPVHILKNATENPKLEFIITFATKYLINSYAKGYKLTLENNNFSPVPVYDKKENELLKSLQDAIVKHPEIVSAMD